MLFWILWGIVMKKSKELMGLFSKLSEKSFRLLESGANDIEVWAIISYRRKAGKFETKHSVYEKEYEVLRVDSDVEDSHTDDVVPVSFSDDT